MSARIAILTTARNDKLFLRKWIAYYGRELGRKNLFVILDGHDQAAPEGSQDVNVIALPHVPLERLPAMRRRARIMSSFAQGLFRVFDIVMATDVDEFIILDPKCGTTLGKYLSLQHGASSVSSLGLDVGRHLDKEGPLDLARPFLDQRRYAHVSARYTKPSIALRPVTWGSGMHRVKGRGFRIDPHLFLFHFGMADYASATGKATDQDRLATGWKGHLDRREKLFQIIRDSKAIDGDAYFPIARRWQSWRRSLLALNKPGMIPGDPVIRIPERFRGIV